MTTDQHNLEQSILRVDMSADVGLLMKQYLDGPKMTEDELANHLMGLEYMMKLRWSDLWENYRKAFSMDSRVGLDGTVLRQSADKKCGCCGSCKLKEHVE